MTPEEPHRSVTLLRDGRDPARGDRRRHHQHRGGVGNADHVPDPARVRRPAGDRQRLQHHRPGARARCPGRSATAASWPASAPRLLRLGTASLVGGVAGAVLLLVLPGRGVRRDRAGADRARLRAGGLPAADQPRGSPPGTTRAGGVPEHGASWVWAAASSLAGVYGGYFGAAQGVLLMAVLGVGLHGDDAAPQRHQERARRARQRRRRDRLRRSSPTWTGASPALIAVGSVDRRPDRRHRRPPAAAAGAAGVIVVVGTVALAKILTS